MSKTIIECYKCLCDKCEHGWITRDDAIPRICPKCKSPKWDSAEPPKNLRRRILPEPERAPHVTLPKDSPFAPTEFVVGQSYRMTLPPLPEGDSWEITNGEVDKDFDFGS